MYKLSENIYKEEEFFESKNLGIFKSYEDADYFARQLSLYGNEYSIEYVGELQPYAYRNY